MTDVLCAPPKIEIFTAVKYDVIYKEKRSYPVPFILNVCVSCLVSA